MNEQPITTSKRLIHNTFFNVATLVSNAFIGFFLSSDVSKQCVYRFFLNPFFSWPARRIPLWSMVTDWWFSLSLCKPTEYGAE